MVAEQPTHVSEQRKALALAAVSEDGLRLCEFPDLAGDRDVALAALANDTQAFQFMSADHVFDRSLAEALIRISETDSDSVEDTFMLFSPSLKDNTKVALAALTINRRNVNTTV